jgi:hypothetical protein
MNPRCTNNMALQMMIVKLNFTLSSKEVDRDEDCFVKAFNFLKISGFHWKR